MLCSEFLGTAVYCLAFNMNGENDVQMPCMLFCLILLTIRISGGHMNPGVSIAVYIEREKYCSNLCYLFIIIVAQVLGAIVAIGFGLILRVTQPVPGH